MWHEECWGCSASLPLLPLHTFSLLPHRSSPWAAVLWGKCAAVCVVCGTQFLQEIVPLLQPEVFRGLQFGYILSRPWSCCSSSSGLGVSSVVSHFWFPLPLSLGCFLHLSMFFREVPHTWWMASAVCWSESFLELAGITCVWHGAAAQPPPTEATPAAPHDQHLDTYTLKDTSWLYSDLWTSANTTPLQL